MPVRADSMFILADDLSGAADCAVGGAKAGLKSIVLLDRAVAESAQVLAVDADSRYKTPEASRATNLAIWRAHFATERLFYKKIDSTLRGNFAADISALVPAGMAVVAPALPQAGRTTRNGRVFVKGVPLERTETWSNERMRGRADLVAMLRAEGVPAVNVPLDRVRVDLGSELGRLASSRQVHAVVCDAEEDDDLEAIARASVGLPVYWVGSAGLLPHVLRAAGLEGRASPPGLALAAPILTVVGSVSTVSRRQARVLERHPDLSALAAAPEILRDGETHPRWQSLLHDVERALSGRGDLMIRTAVGRHDDLAAGHLLCESLGRLLGAVAPRVGALVATGGETARALLLAFGIEGLRVIREVEPGIPLSLALGRRPIPVITKAGAFGSSAALLHCYRELAAIRRNGAGAAREDASCTDPSLR